ncbi:MAG: hypothetical protein NC489_25540 [Ruminococcus flavefaciens]|nr:hypothetical protein [Ruminococcus flavefaciens]
MLTAGQIREKIFRSAEDFKAYYRQEQWSRAKYVYDRASAMAVFMELPETDLAALFGNRAYREDDREPVEKGLFDEELVIRAYDECIRQGRTYEVQPYPGSPAAMPDYPGDVWDRQGGSGAAYSPYEVYKSGA